MKRPDLSWRPSTGHVTTVAIAIVCLLAGFWVGWNNRSQIDPQTITPSVPVVMRTRPVVVTAPAAASSPELPATTSAAASTTTTTTTPAVALLPRAQTHVVVLNAGTTAGAAVQVAVRLVQLGYPTPVTGNVTLPAGQVPTAPVTVPPAATTGTAAAGTTSPATTATTTATTATATAPSTAPPEIVYYRTGQLGVAERLAGDLGVSDIATIPTTGPLVTTDPTAPLLVIIGSA